MLCPTNASDGVQNTVGSADLTTYRQVKSVRRNSRIRPSIRHGCSPAVRVSARLNRFRTHSCYEVLQNSAANHPQITQGEQRMQLLRVLHQPAISDLEMAELALDDAKRMFDLG